MKKMENDNQKSPAQTPDNASPSRKRASTTAVMVEEAKRFCGGDLRGTAEERKLRSRSIQRTQETTEEMQTDQADVDIPVAASLVKAAKTGHFHAPSLKQLCDLSSKSTSTLESMYDTKCTVSGEHYFNHFDGQELPPVTTETVSNSHQLNPSEDQDLPPSDSELVTVPPVFGVPAPPKPAVTSSMIFGQAQNHIFLTAAEIRAAGLWDWTRDIGTATGIPPAETTQDGDAAIDDSDP